MTPSPQPHRSLAKYTPGAASTGRAVLTTLRRRISSIVETVYDNDNGLVVGFSPIERPSGAICSGDGC